MGMDVDRHRKFNFLRTRSGTRLFDQSPNAWRCKWQFIWLDAETCERRGNRIADRSRDRDDAALAGALGAERIGRRASQLERHASYIRKIRGQWQQIIRKRRIEQLGLGIIDQMIKKYAAKPLHGGADRLPMHNAGIDRVTHILDGQIIDDLDMSGSGIDRHVGGMRAIAIGAFGVGEGAFHRKRFCRCGCRLADLGEPDRAADFRDNRPSSKTTSSMPQPSCAAPAARMPPARFLAPSSTAEPPITKARE